jgi:thymidylate synthase ThyX
MDHAFETYAGLIPRMEEHFRRKYPKASEDSDAMYRAVIRAKALDTLRGLLPAATTSNLGLFGSGQAFEMLLLRMLAHPLTEARDCGQAILAELRQVIPAFLARVDHPERGQRWSRYLEQTRETFRATAEPCLAATGEPHPATAAPTLDPEVVLTDFDPEGEIKVVAAALYAVSSRSDQELLEISRRMSAIERRHLLAAYVGDRSNRRHKPGRAFERTSYRFDVLADYGAFRDLQRHRLLSLNWQPLTTAHGYVQPAAVDDVGALDAWRSVMDRSAELHHALTASGLREVAPYAVAMAYRVRFYMDMNAREAMHVIELRTAPQGHPAYRRICQQMHRAIETVAGHQAIADAMRFADHSEVELERLQAERRLEQKRAST